MHRMIHLWLRPTPAQTVALQQTMETVNAARTEISAVAWYTGTFTTRALYELCGEEISTRLGLSFAMTRRCVASVAAAYRQQCRAQQRYEKQRQSLAALSSAGICYFRSVYMKP